LLGLQCDLNSLETYVPLLKRVAVLRTNTGDLVGINFYFNAAGCVGTRYAASYWSYAMFKNSGKHYGGDAMSPIVIICQSYRTGDGSCVDSTADCPSGVVTVHEIMSFPFTFPGALPMVLNKGSGTAFWVIRQRGRTMPRFTFSQLPDIIALETGDTLFLPEMRRI
jgi:hypothetical protein